MFFLFVDYFNEIIIKFKGGKEVLTLIIITNYFRGQLKADVMEQH